jgi:poly(3-hydroxyalkanoate) depolymerase
MTASITTFAQAQERAARRIRFDHLEVDGVTLRVGQQAGRGTPLLMFNGIGANMELAYPFFDAMQGVELVAFDAPGIGGSELDLVPRRFSGLATLAARMLDRLGYGEVDVAGISWGGALAQQFAHQFPQRCRRLVLAATSAGAVMMPGRPEVLWKMATPRRYLSRRYMDLVASDIYGGELRGAPELLAQHAARIRPPTIRGYLYQLLAGAGWTSVHWLHRLRQPTLILAGDDDPIVPLVNARLMAALIPQSRLHVIRGGGHLFLLVQAKALAPEIKDFLGHPRNDPDSGVVEKNALTR